MGVDDEYFVSSCTHVNESAEIDASSRRRSAWFKKMYRQGLRIKVATLNGERVGFIYVMPIEVCPWGPLGRDLAAFPCLVAHSEVKGQGAGRALVAAAEAEAQKQQKKGLATYGYYHDCWFMPAPYFEKLGFVVAARRGDVATLRRYGRGRRIFVDGEEIFWRYRAPREGIRDAISKALTREWK